jgi:hypothetical protein
MTTVTIDGKDYDTEDLSEEALAELGSLQYVDAEIARLQAQTAAMQTARNAYARALQSLLPSDEH